MSFNLREQKTLCTIRGDLEFLVYPTAPHPLLRSKMTKATKVKRRRTSQKSRRKAIREIKKYQEGKSATRMLVPKSCFSRLIREVANNYKFDTRFQEEALLNIQEAAESHLVRLLRAANTITQGQKRLTLKVSDLQLARGILEDKALQPMKFDLGEREDPWVVMETPTDASDAEAEEEAEEEAEDDSFL